MRGDPPTSVLAGRDVAEVAGVDGGDAFPVLRRRGGRCGCGPRPRPCRRARRGRRGSCRGCRPPALRRRRGRRGRLRGWWRSCRSRGCGCRCGRRGRSRPWLPDRRRCRPGGAGGALRDRATGKTGGSASRWWLRSPEAVRNGGLRYSSPQSPGIGSSAAVAAVDAGEVALRRGARRAREVVGAVFGLAQPRADDGGADGGVGEHPARGDVGDGGAVLLSRSSARARRRPGSAPIRPRRRRSACTSCGSSRRSRRVRASEPAIREEAAAEGAEGEDGDVVLQRDVRERARRAAVEEGEADLVRGDLDAVPDSHAQVGGVEVGQADLADRPSSRRRIEVFRASR